MSVTLISPAGGVAIPTVIFSVSGKSAHLVFGYDLSDNHLVSGVYSLKISASDGVNVTNSFLHIQIIASPYKRKAIYLISRNTSAVFVSKVDTNYLITPVQSLSGDYSGSAISSWFQQMYVAGAYTGNFTAINTSTGAISWFKPVVSGFNPWFNGAFVFSNLVYSPYFNGSVKGYDTSGNQKINLLTQSNYHPGKIFLSGNYLLNEQIYVTNNSSKLVVNNSGTGMGLQELALNQSVVQFCEKDPDNIFIFGNNGGQGVIELYTISANGSWLPYTLPAGTILSVSQVDSDTYLIAASDGNIYKYQYSINSMTVFLSGITASVLQYDPLKNEVLASSVNTLRIYDYAGAVLKHTVLHTDTILNFHVLNNK